MNRTNEMKRHLRIFTKLVDDVEPYILFFKDKKGVNQVLYGVDLQNEFQNEIKNYFKEHYKLED